MIMELLIETLKLKMMLLIFIQDIIKLGINIFDTAKKYKGAHEVLQNSIKKDFKKFTIIDKISKKDISSIKKNFWILGLDQ